jgi:hypothetical protein
MYYQHDISIEEHNVYMKISLQVIEQEYKNKIYFHEVNNIEYHLHLISNHLDQFLKYVDLNIVELNDVVDENVPYQVDIIEIQNNRND